MANFIGKTLNPAAYHGVGVKPPFFEGWYYKLVDAGQQRRFAIIPGVFLNDDPDKAHTFIQVMDGESGESHFHRFPIGDFHAVPGKLDLRIGRSHLTDRLLRLGIDSGSQRVRGELAFDRPQPWPVALASPGVMGWFAWVPRMECYHGVLSFDHGITGTLEINGRSMDFSGGRGYIEKDWGKAFPTAYIWTQSNHFERPGVCLTGSIATIPWVGRAFAGFIVGLWLDGSLYRFATYSGARVTRLALSDRQVAWTLEDRRYRLELLLSRGAGGLLHAPTVADMGRRIDETLSATTAVRLVEKPGRVLFEGTGQVAGLEAAGDLAQLQRMAGFSAAKAEAL